MTDELSELFEAVRRRYEDIGPNQRRRQSFLAHIRSLATWEADENDYPNPGSVSFPAEVEVAYAVCHPECGRKDFIVDGSTQECQHCGSLMFRTETATYRLVGSGAE